MPTLALNIIIYSFAFLFAVSCFIAIFLMIAWMVCVVREEFLHE